MNTYTALLKQKYTWRELVFALVILAVFTSVSLQQSAEQKLYAATLVRPPAHRFEPPKHFHLAFGDTAGSTSKPTTAAIASDKAGSSLAQLSTPTVIPTTTASMTTTPAAHNPPGASSGQPPAAPNVTASIVQNQTDIASEAQCPGQSSIAAITYVLPCMTSFARSQHSIAPVSVNQSLMSAATAKIQDMLNCGYSHEACGHTFNYWFAIKGYSGGCDAENIAQGQQSPGQVFVAWMNSAGHRANILNPNYHDIGVAASGRGGSTLWTMELGGC